MRVRIAKAVLVKELEARRKELLAELEKQKAAYPAACEAFMLRYAKFLEDARKAKTPKEAAEFYSDSWDVRKKYKLDLPEKVDEAPQSLRRIDRALQELRLSVDEIIPASSAENYLDLIR